MKGPLTKYYCLDARCGYEIDTHRLMDGLRCPQCDKQTLVGKSKSKNK